MSSVLDVGGRRQLFPDGRLIARSENVRVVMNPARATGEVLLAQDQPHEQQAVHARIGSYSSVMREGGQFRLWWFHRVDRRDGDLLGIEVAFLRRAPPARPPMRTSTSWAFRCAGRFWVYSSRPVRSASDKSALHLVAEEVTQERGSQSVPNQPTPGSCKTW
jgi:hypothetical protein